MEIKIVDSHCHLDVISLAGPDGIVWMKAKGYLPVSWSFAGFVDLAHHFNTYFRNKRTFVHHMNQNGLQCNYLVGVHPIIIPSDLNPAMISDILAPYLDDPFCLGIGEIGLETGSCREKEILSAHLDMAEEVARRGKVFGIHTPRKDKAKITGELLGILEDYTAYRQNIVVDHCTEETIASVLEMGLWAGVTMNPEKNRIADLDRIIHAHKKDIGRIMLNTDSSTSLYRDLFVLSQEESIEDQDRTALLRENALKFYHLE